MAPSGRTRARKARRTIFKNPVKVADVVKPKKKIHKKTHPPPQSSPPSNKSSSSSLISGGLPNTGSIDFEAVDNEISSPDCSTPKAQRFRIPKIVSCPPAPKKPRVNSSSNCLFRRSPIAFFAPPDLELFFHFANRGISVQLEA